MPSSEIRDSSQRLFMDESSDEAFPTRCFFCWFASAPSDRPVLRVSCVGGGCWERVRKAMEEPGRSNKWWVKGWKRIREWSERFAGPGWKTFIRRLNQRRRHRGRHQYDALSYALNFDESDAVHQPEYAHGATSPFGSHPLCLPIPGTSRRNPFSLRSMKKKKTDAEIVDTVVHRSV